MPAPAGYTGIAAEYWERTHPVNIVSIPEVSGDSSDNTDSEQSEGNPETSSVYVPPDFKAPPLTTSLESALNVASQMITNMETDTALVEPRQGDDAHVFVNSDASFDYWKMYATDGSVFTWKVSHGDDSRNVVPGSVSNDGTPNRETATVTPVATSPVKGDSRHVYVGTDSRGDVWQVYDSASDSVFEWAVKPGDDSRSILSGTLNNLGAPVAGANGTIAQRSGNDVASNAPANVVTPAQTVTNAATVKTGADASHKYVGTDSRGDVYQLFDGANVIEWAVPIGGDSRAIIAGTVRNLGAPSSMTVAQATSTPSRPSAPATGGAGTGGGGPNGTAAQPTAVVPVAKPSDAGPTSDPRHKYVGRDARGDVWQLFDGQRVIEWAVKVGDASAAVLPGSYRDLGAPGAGTIAQASDLKGKAIPDPVSGAATTPAVDSKAALYVGLAVVALKALVLT